MDHLGMRVVDKSTETKHMYIKGEYTTRVSSLIPRSSHRLNICTRFTKCTWHPEKNWHSENTQKRLKTPPIQEKSALNCFFYKAKTNNAFLLERDIKSEEALMCHSRGHGQMLRVFSWFLLGGFVVWEQ